MSMPILTIDDALTADREGPYVLVTILRSIVNVLGGKVTIDVNELPSAEISQANTHLSISYDPETRRVVLEAKDNATLPAALRPEVAP